MCQKFSFSILHVLFKNFKEDIMWWQIGELMTNKIHKTGDKKRG